MHIIFDFDGTISNSITGIQNSFDESYLHVFGEKNSIDLYPMIGPPIHLILKKIRPQINEEEIHVFVAEFRKRYDSKGHMLNSLYPEITDVIKKLHQEKHHLHIATFKRRLPLLKIMDENKLTTFFTSIYTYDKIDGSNYMSKADMVKDMIQEQGIFNQNICFLGDSQDDYKAAFENKIPFIFASYGYGINLPAAYTIQKPIELLNVIQNLIQT
jgi:phosphoglycolate phosphatase